MVTNSLVKNQEILLTIKRIGINGEGIGYYRRLAVFVPGALPKEEAVVKITEVKPQYAKAELVRIKGEKSSDRVKPRCPYYEITLCFVEYETNRPSSRVDEFIVILDNGTKLEFDRHSNLKSIECNRSVVPMSVLPERIRTFISKRYPNTTVREYVIDRDFRLEYEVELSNGIELCFNKHYRLINTEYND